MQKHIIIISGILLLLIGFEDPGYTPQRLPSICTMPSFTLMAAGNSSLLHSEYLPRDIPIVLFYFDPHCESCAIEMPGMFQHISEPLSARVYFISSKELPGPTKTFRKHYQLDTVHNAYFGQDYTGSFYAAYFPPTVPFIVIYDNHHRLRMRKNTYQKKANSGTNGVDLGIGFILSC